jgi:hypothetical protein
MRLIPTLALCALLSACGLVKVKGGLATSTTVNGVTERREVKFDRLEDLPAALEQAGTHLSQTTHALKKALVDAPPPGEVRLRDLSPTLARYEGQKDRDFLAAARTEWRAQPREGESAPFTYVRIGVRSYDDFFRRAAELHATAYQIRQVAGRARRLAAAVLDTPPDARTALNELVRRALKAPRRGQAASLASQLEGLRDLLAQSAELAPRVVERTQGLVAAGQGLVAGAAASLTDPRTVLHLDLVKQGLEESISVVGESASLLTELVSELTGLEG